MEKLIAIMQEDSTNNGGQKAIRDIHEIMGWLKHPSVALRKLRRSFLKNSRLKVWFAKWVFGLLGCVV